MNDVSPNNLDREQETLPHRWAWATPLEIGEAALGKMLDRAKHTDGRALPYVRNLNVRWGTFDLSDLLTMRFRDGELARYGLQRGDLLICEGGEPGRCAVWNQEDANIKYQKAIHRLRLFDGVDPYYIMYHLMHDACRGRLSQFFTGSTIKHFTGESLRKLQLRVAPSNEQQRIVAKIDELFSELDAGVASLKRASVLLKKYRQAVLKAAVTGELTRDWRERHKGEIRESGAELLQRILKGRRAAWEAAEIKKLRAKGKPPRDNRLKQKYKEPQPPDTTGLPDLPEGWVWASIDQLAAPERYSITDGPFGSNLKTAHYTDAGPRVVRLENIGEAKFIDIETHIALDHFSKLSKHQILPNDIVIASLGQPLPRACLVPSGLGPAIVKADCIRFKPNRDVVDTRYLMYALNSETVQEAVKRQIHGVGRPRLNLTDIRSLVVPLPPVGEQLVIADAIDDELNVEERSQHEMQRLLSQASALKQSILKAAFAGRLVPQDPDDEPAGVLLERIRAERAAKPKPARGRRRKAQAGARQLELLG